MSAPYALTRKLILNSERTHTLISHGSACSIFPIAAGAGNVACCRILARGMRTGGAEFALARLKEMRGQQQAGNAGQLAAGRVMAVVDNSRADVGSAGNAAEYKQTEQGRQNNLASFHVQKLYQPRFAK